MILEPEQHKNMSDDPESLSLEFVQGLVKDAGRKQKKCSMPDCQASAHAKNLCYNHYFRFRHKICGVIRCLEPSIAPNSLCEKHTKAQQDGEKLFITTKSGCTFEGCTDTMFAKGFCRRHYEKFFSDPRKRLRKMKEHLDSETEQPTETHDENRG